MDEAMMTSCSQENVEAHVVWLRNKTQQMITEERKETKMRLLNAKRMSLSPDGIVLLTASPSGDIKRYLNVLESRSKTTETTLRELRFILSQGANYIDEFFKIPGSLQHLVTYLTCKKPKLQWESAGCLTNLACGSSKQSLKLARVCGAYIILFLNSSSSLLQEQCLWLISNLCCDGSKVCSILIKQGLIGSLLSCLSSCHQHILTQALNASILLLHQANGMLELDSLNQALLTLILSYSDLQVNHLICLLYLSATQSYADQLLDSDCFAKILNHKAQYIGCDNTSVLVVKLILNVLINVTSHQSASEKFFVFKGCIISFFKEYSIDERFHEELVKLACNISKITDLQRFTDLFHPFQMHFENQ